MSAGHIHHPFAHRPADIKCLKLRNVFCVSLEMIR
jgi:hypothetical protein